MVAWRIDNNKVEMVKKQRKEEEEDKKEGDLVVHFTYGCLLTDLFIHR